MKIIKFIAVSAMALMMSFHAAGQANISDARSFQESLLKEFNTGNYTAYLDALHDDFQAYAGVYSPFLFDSRAAWGEFIMGLKSNRSVTYTQRHPQYISVSSSTVICHAYFTFTVVDANGTVSVQNGRETTVLVNTGQAWKAASMHFSVMF
jgi:predicted secreted hydrolase